MSMWKRDFKDHVKTIIEMISKERKINKDGSISLNSFNGLDTWLSILITASRIKRADSFTQKSQIIKASIYSKDLPNNFTERELIQQINIQTEKILNAKRRYKVVFPIFNLPPFLAGKTTRKGLTIQFSPHSESKIVNKILAERKRQRTSEPYSNRFDETLDATIERCDLCIISIDAINEADANERASNSLYEILGLINLINDAGQSWRISFQPSEYAPVSRVVIAPHTTVHRADGKLQYEGYWYEKWQKHPQAIVMTENYLTAWNKSFKYLTHKITTSPWKVSCTNACIDYYKAFSNPNMQDSFLDGWRLLEKITGSNNDDSRTKIRRAANVFEDADIHFLIADHLRTIRNSISHGENPEHSDFEQSAFLMRSLCGSYLMKYIGNGFKLNSPQEFWKLLDSDTDHHKRQAMREDLERSLKILDFADKFRGKD